MYISIKKKFAICIILIMLWLLFAIWLSSFWFRSLQEVLPIWICCIIILSLAISPAIMSGFLICGVILDKQREYDIPASLPDVSILIAAHNEEKSIYETLLYINKQNYNGKLYVKVIDNNSTDNTKTEILRGQNDLPNINIEYLFLEKRGKYAALNYGLSTVNTKYFITLDADTVLYGDALNNLVAHIEYESKNKKIGAVAGSIMVRNSRDNLITKLQEWEYFLCIAGIKRSQGLFSSTLVTQGAFSIFNTDVIKSIGGWKDSIGEDIVLTWDVLAEGYQTQFEPNAVAFTKVPITYNDFRKQKSRWARGMVEGLKQRSAFKYPDPFTKVHIFLDYLLFIIDFALCFIWFPGLIAAIFWHNFLIVGPFTLLVLPITGFMLIALYVKEKKKSFDQLGLKIRAHYFAFIVFMLTYNLLVAPAAFIGYIQEIFNFKREW